MMNKLTGIEAFVLLISADSVLWERLCCRGTDEGGLVCAGSSQGGTQSISLIVALTWSGWGGVQTPLGLQGLVDWLGGGELEVASLLGDHSTLMGRLKLGDQLGLEATGLLWVQVTHLFGDIDQGGDGLVVTLLVTLLNNTAGTANLDGQLLTLGVTNKLAGLLLNIFGGAAGLVHSPALFGALTIAHLLQGPVALLDVLVDGLLLESDLTRLLKVLLTDLLLGWGELRDICVVALLDVLVCAFQDGVLGDSLDGLFFFDTAESGLWVVNTGAEVNSSLDGAAIVLTTLTGGNSPFASVPVTPQVS